MWSCDDIDNFIENPNFDPNEYVNEIEGSYQMECPECEAQNQVRTGHTTVCWNCGKVLTGGQD